jgi:hypothetical protein
VSRVRKGERKHGPSISPSKTAHRYLSIEFRDELRRKAYRHLVNADFRHTSDGARFPKNLTELPIFGAIQHVRWYTSKIFRDEPPLYDLEPFHIIGRYVFNAILMDRPGQLRDLATILELCGPPRSFESNNYIPWIYYSASAALRYLDDGVLPAKRQVLEEAIRQRAIDEVLLSSPPSGLPGEALAIRGLVAVKIEDITKYRSPRKWAHIFRVLDLRELPV